MLASVAWAAGSLYALRAEQPSSPFLSTGMQMLCGGAWLLLAGTLTGEWKTINLAHASLRSWIAVSYLLIFSSLIGFTTYVWLWKATTPGRASTYAYVNPVVALFLGWLLAGEVVTARTVVLIISRQVEAAPQTYSSLKHFKQALKTDSAPRNSPPRGFPSSTLSPRFFTRLLVTHPRNSITWSRCASQIFSARRMVFVKG